MRAKDTIKHFFKWGEHTDFGIKLLEYVFDWRTIASMAGAALLSLLSSIFEHRPWSEIIVLGLAVLVLLLALLWGGAIAWQWWRDRQTGAPGREESKQLAAISTVVPNAAPPIPAAPTVPIVATTPKPEPDTTVKWAFDHLCALANLNAAKHDTRPIWRRLRDAAHSGKITVWGRADSGTLSADQFTKPMQIVPPDHWLHYDFDALRCLVGDDDTSFARTTPEDEKKHSLSQGYADLRLSRVQIEALGETPRSRRIITLVELFETARRDLGLRFDDSSLDIYTLSKALRQAGVDSSIKFFGRKLPYGRRSDITLKNAVSTVPLQPIPPAHFQNYQIEFQPIANGDDNFNTHTHAAASGSPLIYSDLHVDREDMARWLQTDAKALMDSYRRVY